MHTRASTPSEPDQRLARAAGERLPGDLRDVVEKIPGIVYVATPGEQGTWLYVSPQIEAILGYSPEEWCAHPALWFERLHPDDRERALADEDHSRATGEPLDSEYRMIARDGRLIWFHDRASVMGGDSEGPGVFQGVMLDISERKRAEEELERSRRGLAEAQRVAHLGSWRWESASDRVTMSDTLHAIFGTKSNGSGKTLERSLTELVHPEDRELVDRIVERALQPPYEPFSYEARFIRGDGEIRTLDVRGESLLDRQGDLVGVVGTAQDVTDHRQVQAALRRTQELTQAIVESALDCVITMDVSGIVREFNPAAEAAFGYSRAEAVGKELAELIVPERLRTRHREGLRRYRETGEAHIVGRRLELVAARADGTEFPVELSITRIGQEPPMFTAFLRDISERKQAEQALHQSHDRMRSIIDNSPSMIHAKDRSLRYLFANREFGRVFGVDHETIAGQTDETVLPLELFGLVRASDRRVLEMAENVEEEQVINCDGEDHTFLTQRFPLHDPDGSVYAVCAIATDITERKEVEEELRREVDWANRVREAVAKGAFLLHSQPILDLRSNEVNQEELLVRMVGSRGGEDLVYPGEFLPYAERFGLVQEVDRWVVFEAIRLARTRKVEVNLSGKSIGDPTLLRLIEAQLGAQSVDPGNVIFEITETAAAENIDAARDFAERLIGLGCGFALDDFGTGYGSFTYLKHLPVTHLKIDMEFVRDLSSDEADQKIVGAVIAVAHNFGIETIAEGVEDEATLEILREAGVDYAQGYLIGRPRPV